MVVIIQYSQIRHPLVKTYKN